MTSTQNQGYCEIWVRFREVTAVNHPAHSNQSSEYAWLPPECPAGFEESNISPWYIWRPGEMEERETTLPSDVQIYDQCSIFYSNLDHRFFEVPYDCTVEHVCDRRRSYEGDGWRRISFTRAIDHSIQLRKPHLWLIGHCNKKEQISDCNISDSWKDLLLPSSFENGRINRNVLPTCELAGKLTMILGILALNAETSDVIHYIRDSFRPERTKTHIVPSWATGREQHKGLVHGRGIVTEVAFDSTKYSSNQIEDWEHGKFGPILTSSDDYVFDQVRTLPAINTVPEIASRLESLKFFDSGYASTTYTKVVQTNADDHPGPSVTWAPSSSHSIVEDEEKVGPSELSICEEKSCPQQSNWDEYLEAQESAAISDECQSVMSDAESVHSRAATNSSKTLFDSERRVAALLAANHFLATICKEALSRVDKYRLKRQLRRLLKKYFISGKDQAMSVESRTIIEILRSRWSRVRIAGQILDIIQPDEEEEEEEVHGSQVSKDELLADWLSRQPQYSSELLNSNDANNQNARDKDVSEDDESTFSEHNHVVDSIRSEDLEGPPLDQLVFSLCLFLLPPSMHLVNRNILSALDRKAWIVEEEPGSLRNSLKLAMQDFTRENWIWWPLEQPQLPLSSSKFRICWYCHCGGRQWHDIPRAYLDTYRVFMKMTRPESAPWHLCRRKADKLLSWTQLLRLTMAALAPVLGGRSSSEAVSAQRPDTSHSTGRIGSTGSSPGCSDTISTDPTSYSAVDTQSQNAQDFSISSSTSHLHDRFFLLGIDGMRRSLDIVNMNRRRYKTDGAFFRDIKREWTMHRGFCRRWLTLYILDHCDFAKFEKVRSNLVVWRERGIPIGKEYEYTPRPQDRQFQNPPISAHEFHMAFNTCTRTCFLSSLHDCIHDSQCDSAMERIPKRKKQLIESGDEREIFWGLRAKSAISLIRVLVLHLLIIAASAGFWICWQIYHPGDLQNASVLAALALTSISTCWTVVGVMRVQKQLED